MFFRLNRWCVVDTASWVCVCVCVAVLGVGAGGGRPLQLRGSWGVIPEIFFENFDAKSRVWGNLGQKIN